MARGRSGGLIFMWDPSVFVKNNIWCGDNYTTVKGKWMNSVEDYFLINVYDPQQQPEKANLWAFLRSFIQDHSGKVVLFGDLNEVLDETERFDSSFTSGDAGIFNSFIHERFDSSFTSGDAGIFNSFIHEVGLLDLPMGEDRFGTIPFKIFHSWFGRKDFDCVIKEAWANVSIGEDGLSKSLHEKLKGLKYHLRQWYSQVKVSEGCRKKEILVSLETIEEKIDAGSAIDEERELHINKLHE
ncbi:RNA-directed DNA polymerase, eukaryota, Reverse transcriptase zinc-binding domain protein [Artemisia annua]|uniref:RNA-directed DNA polymerase, eukaryota, Reverse transcriptase zinc-binding domain protein n=1 Tax=Artemisia annua TaxID=35608 RepID=A0A2U1L115_ARTAN|nr:RNA-directed DNA polymerase, eukaryota, Reverse transcriptase zinc-binding domain protein [Artemisia annua]